MVEKRSSYKLFETLLFCVIMGFVLNGLFFYFHKIRVHQDSALRYTQAAHEVIVKPIIPVSAYTKPDIPYPFVKFQPGDYLYIVSLLSENVRPKGTLLLLSKRMHEILIWQKDYSLLKAPCPISTETNKDLLVLGWSYIRNHAHYQTFECQFERYKGAVEKHKNFIKTLPPHVQADKNMELYRALSYHRTAMLYILKNYGNKEDTEYLRRYTIDWFDKQRLLVQQKLIPYDFSTQIFDVSDYTDLLQNRKSDIILIIPHITDHSPDSSTVIRIENDIYKPTYIYSLDNKSIIGIQELSISSKNLPIQVYNADSKKMFVTETMHIIPHHTFSIYHELPYSKTSSQFLFMALLLVSIGITFYVYKKNRSNVVETYHRYSYAFQKPYIRHGLEIATLGGIGILLIHPHEYIYIGIFVLFILQSFFQTITFHTTQYAIILSLVVTALSKVLNYDHIADIIGNLTLLLLVIYSFQLYIALKAQRSQPHEYDWILIKRFFGFLRKYIPPASKIRELNTAFHKKLFGIDITLINSVSDIPTKTLLLMLMTYLVLILLFISTVLTTYRIAKLADYHLEVLYQSHRNRPYIDKYGPHIVYQSSHVVIRGRNFGWKRNDIQIMSDAGVITAFELQDSKIVFTVPLSWSNQVTHVWIIRKTNGLTLTSEKIKFRLLPRDNTWDDDDSQYFDSLKREDREIQILNGL